MSYLKVTPLGLTFTAHTKIEEYKRKPEGKGVYLTELGNDLK